MYKKKVIIDSDNELTKVLKDLNNEEAIQVWEKGQDVKVIITQEEYFKLLTLKESGNKDRTPYNIKELKRSFDKRMKEIDKAFDKHNKEKNQGISTF